jgi:hypothetical protein
MKKKKNSKVDTLTSRFPLSELDLDFFYRKLQIKVHKQYETYTMLMQTIISYYSEQ